MARAVGADYCMRFGESNLPTTIAHKEKKKKKGMQQKISQDVTKKKYAPTNCTVSMNLIHDRRRHGRAFETITYSCKKKKSHAFDVSILISISFQFHLRSRRSAR